MWPYSGLLGFVVGAVVVGAIWLIRHPWSASARLDSDVVPDGLDTALEVIGATGLVLDQDNRVLRASRTALKLGLVEDREIAIDKVKALIERAKKKSKAVQE